jgi:hypothetical protein
MQVLCPATAKPIIPDAAMLMMRSPTPISCPACAGTHLWDPKRRVLLAEAVGPQQPGRAVEPP